MLRLMLSSIFLITLSVASASTWGQNIEMASAFGAPAVAVSSSSASAATPSDTASTRAQDIHALIRTPRLQPVKMAPRPTFNLTAGTLGAGAELNLPINPHVAMRLAYHQLDLTINNLRAEQVNYTVNAHLRSATAQVDLAPFGGSFRISPGVMVYNGNRASANGIVPTGQSFDYGDSTYISGTDPIHADAKLVFGYSLSPMMTVGWHSVLPNRWRISMPVELGAVYTGTARLTLNIAGSGCDTQGNCGDLSTDPDAQKNLQIERDKYINTLSQYPFLPVVQIGLGYRFGRGRAID